MDKFIDTLKKGFNIAVNEAGKLKKVVADKTTNIVDVTKLNLSLNEAERKTGKLYEKIGEIVYENYASGNDVDIELRTICAEIETLKEEADNLKEQIAALKNAAVCPSCGQQNDKSGDYCSKCGEKLTPEKPSNDMVIEVTDFPEDE